MSRSRSPSVVSSISLPLTPRMTPPIVTPRGEEKKLDVALRIRPPQVFSSSQTVFLNRQGELVQDAPAHWRWNNTHITCDSEENTGTRGVPEYTFKQIFSPQVKTPEVFETVAKPIVHKTFHGYNGCIFAYGQTNTGKTYTIHGDENTPGIIPLAVEEMFKLIQNAPAKAIVLRVSYLEIYNEVLKDLLNPNHVQLQMQDHPERGVMVVGLSEVTVTTLNSTMTLLREGEERRMYGQNNVQEHASRSHTIFQLILECKDATDNSIRVSTMSLVDLAGSETNYVPVEPTPEDVLEPMKQAQYIGARAANIKDKKEQQDRPLREREGRNIRKSLLSLVRVVNVLSTKPHQHIPFRDSKLTRILQPALGGSSNTAVICTMNPAEVKETHSTLRFASTAQKVTNRPKIVNALSYERLSSKLNNDLWDLRQEMEDKEREWDKFFETKKEEDKEWKIKLMDEIIKLRQVHDEKVAEQKEQIHEVSTELSNREECVAQNKLKAEEKLSRSEIIEQCANQLLNIVFPFLSFFVTNDMKVQSDMHLMLVEMDTRTQLAEQEADRKMREAESNYKAQLADYERKLRETENLQLQQMQQQQQQQQVVDQTAQVNEQHWKAREDKVRELEESINMKSVALEKKQDKTEAKLADLAQRELNIAKRSNMQTQAEAGLSLRQSELNKQAADLLERERELNEREKQLRKQQKTKEDEMKREQDQNRNWHRELQEREEQVAVTCREATECKRQLEEEMNNRKTEEDEQSVPDNVYLKSDIFEHEYSVTAITIQSATTVTELSSCSSSPSTHRSVSPATPTRKVDEVATSTTPQRSSYQTTNTTTPNRTSQYSSCNNSTTCCNSVTPTKLNNNSVEAPPMKCGWVFRHKKIGPVHSWSKRWLTIRNGGLSYTRFPTDPPSRKITPLSIVYSVHEEPLNDVTLPKDDTFRAEYGLSYCIERKKQIILCESKMDRLEWMHALTHSGAPSYYMTSTMSSKHHTPRNRQGTCVSDVSLASSKVRAAPSAPATPCREYVAIPARPDP